MHLKTVDEILDFAINREMEAAQMYADLALEAKTSEMKKFWIDLEKEEISHKEKLIAMKEGKKLDIISGKIMNIDILECVKITEMNQCDDYLKALVYAMSMEKSEFKMYKDLAAISTDKNIIDTLNILAQEEARHKLLLEIEYDEYLLING